MPVSTVKPFNDVPYIRRISHFSVEKLLEIDEYLQLLIRADDASLECTHFFNGRYENLYIRSNVPTLLQDLMRESVSICSEMLEVNSESLTIGFWFNLMEPGQVTTLHRHDDLDEVISGVIYLKVPEHSGDLVIHHNDEKFFIQPESGNYIFFDPETPHEVTENRSKSYRLSIGMNIGIPEG